MGPPVGPIRVSSHKDVGTLVDELSRIMRPMGENSFGGAQALVEVLDMIAISHPFIQPLVGAFRVAVELYAKRSEGDKKVTVGFFAMRDMMAVLVNLRDFPANVTERQSVTIAASMRHLVEKAGQDIEAWANLSDAYAKKGIMSRVLQSTAWNERFKERVHAFLTRRVEFEHAVSISAGRPDIDVITQRIDRVLEIISNTRLEEDQLRSIFIDTQQDDHGGVSRATWSRTVADEDNRLNSGIESAISENMEQFQRKFTIYRRELEGKALQTIQNNSDLTAEPHAQVLDPDIQEIWKEMVQSHANQEQIFIDSTLTQRWRGSVKGQHFVFALRGYFRDKIDQHKSAKSSARPTAAARQLSEQDEPILEYIHTAKSQSVIEAFDDDASGSITLAKVNMFTDACPKNWSLLHWLAYWAVGFQVCMSSYAAKIDDFLSQMVALKSVVLPANRTVIDHYLDYVWTRTVMLTSAFRRVDLDEEIRRNFEEYAQAEEQRLSQNLETFKYVIDEREIFDLICGSGQIEKHIFPLLYVLLKRNLEVLQQADTQVLREDWLSGSESTISHVFDVVDDRHKYLTDLFLRRKLDPALQFQTFAFEMFKNWNDKDAQWKMQDITLLKMPHSESAESQDSELTSISNHAHQLREEIGESLVVLPNAVHRDVSCGACGESVSGARVVCLSCGPEPATYLCDRESCLGSEVRHDPASLHLPSHDVVKIPATMGHPFHELEEVYHAAESALKDARQAFVSVSANGLAVRENVGAGNQWPACVGCGEQVSQPCWYCVECKEPCFVCVSCDAKRGGVSSGEHAETHTLVRCQSIPACEDVDSIPAADLDSRMNTLEKRLMDMDRTMADGFAAQQRKTASLEERLKHIEDLLLNLGERSR